MGLPTVKKASEISLDVISANIVLEVDGKYYLDMPLPYEIEEDGRSAFFDKAKQVLTLELPVKPKPCDPSLMAFAGSLSTDEVSDDDGVGEQIVTEEGDSADDKSPPDLPWEDNIESSDETTPALLHPDNDIVCDTSSDQPSTTHELLEIDPGGNWARISAQPESVEPPSIKNLVEVVEDVQSSFESGGSAGIKSDVESCEEMLPKDGQVSDDCSAARLCTSSGEAALDPILQQYVDATTSLGVHVVGGEFRRKEPAFEWRQSRQNVILFLQVPVNHEVRDVRLRLVARQLTVSFHSRPGIGCQTENEGALDESSDERHVLCRTLVGGTIDSRQWHPEVLPGNRLALTMRKVRQNELWDSLFADTDDDLEDLPVGKEIFTVTGGDGAWDERESCNSSISQALSREFDGHNYDEIEEDAVMVEDSAELGVAVSMVHTSSDRHTPPPVTVAALGESAIVTGMGVLLQTHVIYELL